MRVLAGLGIGGAAMIALLLARAPAPQPGAAAPPSYLVVHVRDGDTIEVLTPDGLRVPVRLLGVDAPDRGEPGCAEGKAALAELLLGRRVRIQQDRARPLERWNRVLARVYADDLDVQAWLVAEGHAVRAP